jgi:hypothetical protein
MLFLILRVLGNVLLCCSVWYMVFTEDTFIKCRFSVLAAIDIFQQTILESCTETRVWLALSWLRIKLILSQLTSYSLIVIFFLLIDRCAVVSWWRAWPVRGCGAGMAIILWPIWSFLRNLASFWLNFSMFDLYTVRQYSVQRLEWHFFLRSLAWSVHEHVPLHEGTSSHITRLLKIKEKLSYNQELV